MKIDEEKLYQAYYEPDRLWTGGKVITELQIKHAYVENRSNQIMVSKTIPLASSYTTSKRNTSSSLSCDKT